MMGRPRSKGNKDIPEGLYPPSNGRGSWRMKHPLTGRRLTLQTKDKAQAISRYWKLKARYEDQVIEQLDIPKCKTNTTTLLQNYINDILPKSLSRKGTPLGKSTIEIYSYYLNNAQEDKIFNLPITVFGHLEKGPETVRKYLAQYLSQAKTYNNRKSSLSRFFDYCIDLGEIQRNPCQVIKNRTAQQDKTYLPHNHYLEIMNQLTIDQKSEVYARACDWIYLVSGRVNDMLDIKEKQIINDSIHYQASKNNQPVIVEMDNELRELVKWFQDYKKKQNIISRFLIVHPKTAPRGQATKPITGKRLYIYFKKASKKLGYMKYHLRHLRAKALTDEAVLAGEATNKGAHRTESMRQRYVKKKVPMVVQNNIKRLK